MKQKPSLLIFCDYFLPGYKAGGPTQSCANIAFAFKEKYHVYIFCSDRDFKDTESYSNIQFDQWIQPFDNSISVFYASAQSLSYGSIKQIVNQLKPQFIHLNHLFSTQFVIFPLLLWWRKQIRGKMVVSPRGALFDSALHHANTYPKKIVFLKLMKWLNVFKHVHFHATNQREQNAIEKYFPDTTITIADNLPNMQQKQLELTEKDDGKLKCIFIARIVPIKNALYLLKLLHTVKGDVILSIVGPNEDEAYWEACENEIKSLPSNITVEYLGAVPNNKLASLMKQHHLFILPTKGENFGHAIIEAFLAGRPVIISDQTPWRRLEQQHIGWDLPLENTHLFVQAINEAINWNQNRFDEYATNAWNFAHQFIHNPELTKPYTVLFSNE